MKTELSVGQTARPGDGNAKTFAWRLLRKLKLGGQRLVKNLQDLDFAIQMRLALWAMKRRRQRGERPQIL